MLLRAEEPSGIYSILHGTKNSVTAYSSEYMNSLISKYGIKTHKIKIL